jgi:hypothetical protein
MAPVLDLTGTTVPELEKQLRDVENALQKMDAEASKDGSEEQ